MAVERQHPDLQLKGRHCRHSPGPRAGLNYSIIMNSMNLVSRSARESGGYRTAGMTLAVTERPRFKVSFIHFHRGCKQHTVPCSGAAMAAAGCLFALCQSWQESCFTSSSFLSLRATAHKGATVMLKTETAE